MYVDGLVFAVPSANKQAFIDYANGANNMMKDYGCTRIVYAWGDELQDGQVTDFKKAVQAKDDETVVYCWHEWPDKATRDQGHKKMREGMQSGDSHMNNPPPFDGMRMIFGGFEPIIEISSNL